MKAIKEIKTSTYIILGLLLMYFAFTSIIVVKNTVSRDICISTPGEFEDTWKTYFFRSGLWSHGDSIWTYYLTGQLQSEEVILGSNGWLFFKAVNDSDTIADFEGTNSYSSEDYAKCEAGLEKLERYCDQKGTRYAVVFPPNKENVYPEFMPRTYRHVPVSRTDKLASEMQKKGYNVVNLKEILIDSKDVLMQEYYSYDTHWNQIGAYEGLKMCLDSMGIDTVPLETLEINDFYLNDYGYHTGAMDDLAQIVGMRDLRFTNDTEYVIKEFPQIDWERYERESDQLGYVEFHNEHAKTNKSLLLVGDSFRSAMIPGSMYYFSKVYVAHYGKISAEELKEITADYVIFEFVERYSQRALEIGDLFIEEKK